MLQVNKLDNKCRKYIISYSFNLQSLNGIDTMLHMSNILHFWYMKNNCTFVLKKVHPFPYLKFEFEWWICHVTQPLIQKVQSTPLQKLLQTVLLCSRLQPTHKTVKQQMNDQKNNTACLQDGQQSDSFIKSFSTESETEKVNNTAVFAQVSLIANHFL